MSRSVVVTGPNGPVMKLSLSAVELSLNQVAFNLSEDEQACFVDGEMQVHCLKYYKYAARPPLVLSD